jgi:NAD(P)-dependent dehydrogenase (short-subunit alcohol dehydrogenase family)
MRNREKVLLGALAGAGVYWGAKAWLRSRRRIDLADRVVIVTGASSGHGLVVARHAAEWGARLVLAARHFEALQHAEADLRRLGAPDVLAVSTDVSDRRQVQAMVDQAVDRFGRIDILINNAGIISVGPFENMTLDDFRAAMDTNFWGAVHATMAVVPHMRARGFGRIGNVVSLSGKLAAPHLLPYTASKFALTGFTEGLRAELARDNILVTGIYPSTMRTGGHRHAWFKGQRQEEYAWFALSDSLPVISASAEHVARSLWRAVCNGEPEVVVGWPAHLAIALHHLCPSVTAEVLALVDRVLPAPPEPEQQDGRAIQGQNLRGTLPDWLNRVASRQARPGLG